MEFITQKRFFLKSFLLMSPLYDVTISKKKNSYIMAMDDPIRIIFVPLNFILQGLSDKNQK